MRLPIYQVDAFTDELFRGNPAAVVPLTTWLPDDLMQKIAAENNLAETAFILRDGADWAIRWFTPTVEIDLCGHATLASAFVITRFLDPQARHLRFASRTAGTLEVSCDGEMLTLDFPSRPATTAAIPDDVVAALGGGGPLAALQARALMLVYDQAATIQALTPDFSALAQSTDHMVIVTAPGTDVDFVSRVFAPNEGIPEDPVTGAAHCTLIPYWAERLGRSQLAARQVSARGGRLQCGLAGDRVKIGGHAVLYLEGHIHV